MRRKRGYDQFVVRDVLAATPVTPAIELGRFCVEHNIPVEQIADRLGVTRTTVYSWFTGRSKPRPAKVEAVIALLASLRSEL